MFIVFISLKEFKIFCLDIDVEYWLVWVGGICKLLDIGIYFDFSCYLKVDLKFFMR